MHIACISPPATNSSAQFRPTTNLWLFRNHSPDYLSAHLSVYHLLQAYGKDVPEIITAKHKVYQPKANGMFFPGINIWHRDE